MTTDEDLLHAVATAYASEPESAITWPAPRAEDEEPREEEYSRVSEPERYRIVGARARAWVRALVELDLARAESVADAPEWAVAGSAVTVLQPRSPGSAPLVVAEETVDGVPGAFLSLGVGEPAVLVAREPDCGCDACDEGSENLLDALDQVWLGVVSRDFVWVEGRGWSVMTTADGWSASSSRGDDSPDAEEVVARARAGDEVGTRRIVSRAWTAVGRAAG